MKIYYNSESLDNCTENESIFAHRDVSLLHEERVKIKDAVMETLLSGFEKLTNREKEYWLLHRQGIKNKEISQIMNIDLRTCKILKYRASKKIVNFSKNLMKNIKN